MEALGAILGSSWGLLEAVLALGSPYWAVLARLGALLSRLKIDVKIDQKIDAFQDRFLEDFGGFLEEKWRHVGTKIDQKSMPTSKSDFLKKPCFSLGKTMILRVEGVEVGSKNRSKIDKKMESRWEDILGSVFSGFWWILASPGEPGFRPKSLGRCPSKKERKLFSTF